MRVNRYFKTTRREIAIKGKQDYSKQISFPDKRKINKNLKKGNR